MISTNPAVDVIPGVAPDGLGMASTHTPAVSWAAVFAGAVAAAALSLILLILGTGLGLSSVPPWSDQGINATSFGFSTIAWISLTSLAASGLGGYIAGRLRAKWVSIHTDETYFRDTAHGLLAWAVATLLTACLLTSVIGSIVGGASKAAGSVASGVGIAAASATTAGAAAAGNQSARSVDSGSLGYFTDSLFRKNPSLNVVNSGATTNGPPPPSDDAAASGEVTRILANAVATGSLPPDDLHYLGQVIAQHTGLTPDDAEKRVTDTYTKLQAKIQDAKTTAEDDANKARKASAYAALWLFISLLLGAFSASLMATFGGRQRDFSQF